jgi:hypothetical protein
MLDEVNVTLLLCEDLCLEIERDIFLIGKYCLISVLFCGLLLRNDSTVLIGKLLCVVVVDNRMWLIVLCCCCCCAFDVVSDSDVLLLISVFDFETDFYVNVR